MKSSTHVQILVETVFLLFYFTLKPLEKAYIQPYCYG